MATNWKPAALCLGLAAAGLGLAGAAQGRAGIDPNAPVRCVIQNRTLGGALGITGSVTALANTTGTYAFSVTGGGSDIRQSGDFDLAAGKTATIGQATLAGPSATYSITIELEADGRRNGCTAQISAP